MTTATTKDALADVIREAWHEMGYYGRADLAPGWLDGFASVTADAVLASEPQVVVDTLNDVADFLREQVGPQDWMAIPLGVRLRIVRAARDIRAERP